MVHLAVQEYRVHSDHLEEEVHQANLDAPEDQVDLVLKDQGDRPDLREAVEVQVFLEVSVPQDLMAQQASLVRKDHEVLMDQVEQEDDQDHQDVKDQEVQEGHLDPQVKSSLSDYFALIIKFVISMFS